MTNRRNFIKSAGLATAAVGFGLPQFSFNMKKADLFKISLAEWSLNRPLFAGKMNHLDFAIEAKKTWNRCSRVCESVFQRQSD
ncbi:twin-arginine translocation signal domain-containing protein [Algoriphagus boritolerans]|uniref:twin-arginine translocation signal domain-containing protein n=1 Tax=Algoriphagus boritolerans TaxID=308111 RepID=UPI000AAD21DD